MGGEEVDNLLLYKGPLLQRSKAKRKGEEGEGGKGKLYIYSKCQVI